MLHRLRWPTQVSSDCHVLLSRAAVAGIITLTFSNVNDPLSVALLKVAKASRGGVIIDIEGVK